jgi:hypothetical protein
VPSQCDDSGRLQILLPTNYVGLPFHVYTKRKKEEEKEEKRGKMGKGRENSEFSIGYHLRNLS